MGTDPRNNSDYYMVLSFLHSASMREHAKYLGGRKSPPPPTDRNNEGGQNIRRTTEGRSETAGSGGAEERVNLGNKVETL